MPDKEKFLEAEYKGLSEYFGKAITFRFTTAAFFIAAVAIVLGARNPSLSHYALLLAISIGVWIVELRTRSLFANLIARGQAIETEWGEHVGRAPVTEHDHMTFFHHIQPRRKDPKVPGEALLPDESRILFFKRIRTSFISHTIGLDIVYLSVIVFAALKVVKLAPSTVWATSMSHLDPISAVLSLLLVAIGAHLVREGAWKNDFKPILMPSMGVILMLGAAVLVYFSRLHQ